MLQVTLSSRTPPPLRPKIMDSNFDPQEVFWRNLIRSAAERRARHNQNQLPPVAQNVVLGHRNHLPTIGQRLNGFHHHPGQLGYDSSHQRSATLNFDPHNTILRMMMLERHRAERLEMAARATPMPSLLGGRSYSSSNQLSYHRETPPTPLTALVQPRIGSFSHHSAQQVAQVQPPQGNVPDRPSSSTQSASSFSEPSAEASMPQAEAAPRKRPRSKSDKSSKAAAAPRRKESPSLVPVAAKDNKWLASFEQLVEYKKEHGDCIVPRGYSPNSRLASWVAEQRKQYKLLQDGKASSITRERVERLNSINFAWNAQGAAWERHLQDLRCFKEEYGDCLVPLNHHKYPKLGLWVKEQRRHYTLLKQGKASHMTEERVKALDEIGFCWDTHEEIWGERLRELLLYKAEKGDCLVPTTYPENAKLGTWVHHQRRQYKKYKDGDPCHITLERIRALESIGFVWNPRDQAPSRSRSRSASLGTTSSQDDEESSSDMDLTSFDLRPAKRRKHRKSG